MEINDVIKAGVEEVVKAEIFKALDDKEFLKQAIKNQLDMRVDNNGYKARESSWEDKQTLLEYCMRKALQENVRNLIEQILEQHREELTAMLKDLIMKKDVVESMAEAFLKKLISTAKHDWSCKIDFIAPKKEDEDE